VRSEERGVRREEGARRERGGRKREGNKSKDRGRSPRPLYRGDRGGEEEGGSEEGARRGGRREQEGKHLTPFRPHKRVKTEEGALDLFTEEIGEERSEEEARREQGGRRGEGEGGGSRKTPHSPIQAPQESKDRGRSPRPLYRGPIRPVDGSWFPHPTKPRCLRGLLGDVA
jgi:hypothetical protein